MNNNYNFISMVDEAYELLNSKTKITNEQSLDKHEFLDTNLLLPKLDIETTITKLYWKNIQAYLTIINRPDEHFIIFIKNELCNNKINWYSDNKKDVIIINGKYQKVKIILKSYLTVKNIISCLFYLLKTITFVAEIHLC